MTIETKYNIGDEVWFIVPFKEIPWHTKVLGISIEDDKIAYKIHFAHYDHFFREEMLFPSEMELLESLRRTNQNEERDYAI